MWRQPVILWSSGLWLAVVAAEAPSFETARILPDNTAAYVEVTDFQELTKRLSEMDIARLMQDDGLRPCWQAVKSVMEEGSARLEQTWGISATELLSVPQGKLVLAVVSRPGDVPGLVLLMDMGPQPEVLRGLVELGEQSLLRRGAEFSRESVGDAQLSVFQYRGPAPDGESADGESADGGERRELASCERDSVLLVATQSDVARKLLQTWPGGGKARVSEKETARRLAADDDYRQVMDLADRRPQLPAQLRFFLNPLAAAYAMTARNVGAQAGLAMAPILGLDGFQAVGGQISVADDRFDWILDAHLLLKSPRKGIAEALALEGDTAEVPDWVPASVVNCTTFRWNMRRTKDAVERLVDGFRGEGATQQMIENRLSAPLGVDLEQDVLRQLTGRYLRLKWNLPEAASGAPVTLWGAQLKDPETFQKTFDEIVGRQADFLDERTFDEITCFVIETPADDRRRRNRWGGRREATFALIDDYIVMADRSELIEAIATCRPRDTLTDSDEFRRASRVIRQDLGIAYPAAATYNNSEEIWRFRHALLASPEVREAVAERFSSATRFQSLMQALEQHPLPDFSTLRRYFPAGGSAITDEENGMHYVLFQLSAE